MSNESWKRSDEGAWRDENIRVMAELTTELRNVKDEFHRFRGDFSSIIEGHNKLNLKVARMEEKLDSFIEDFNGEYRALPQRMTAVEGRSKSWAGIAAALTALVGILLALAGNLLSKKAP